MKVFISWSGDLSGRLAGAIREWLPNTLSYVKPFFTPADIEKGANWAQEMSTQLKQSGFCVIALTRESLNSNWIMFEAGAISSSVEKPRICAILFGIETTDLQGPLTAYQAAKFSKEDIHKLVRTINSNAGEAAIENGRLDRIFEKWWPELDESVRKIMSNAGSPGKAPVRSDRDLLEEAVNLSRVIAEEQRQIREMVAGVRQFATFNSNQLANTALASTAMVNALLKGETVLKVDATPFKLNIPSAQATLTSASPTVEIKPTDKTIDRST